VHHVIRVITSLMLSLQTLRKRKRSEITGKCVCVCVSPQVDEVDEFGGELPLLGAAELRRVALHHLRQLIEHTVPLRVGEPSCGQFVLKHTHTQ